MLRSVPDPLQVSNKFYLELYYYCYYRDQLARFRETADLGTILKIKKIGTL